MPKTVGTLFSEARLLAKTVNRLTVEPEQVDLTYWKYEGKLLCSPMGDCLSSATLLVKGTPVPTYGIDGRCYGILLDAEKCYIYDVNYVDANTNRTDKLKKRAERHTVNMLTENSQGAMTLDSLASTIKEKGSRGINEVLLDAPKEACIGLFVRKINLEEATPAALKNYYQSLMEVKLVHKLFMQAFDFPSGFKIYQYAEDEGKLYSFPDFNDLKSYLPMHKITQKSYPRLFEMLEDEYKFKQMPEPKTVEMYLTDKGVSPAVKEEVFKELAQNFMSLDNKTYNSETIRYQPVDDIIGVTASRVDDMIEKCMNPPASKRTFKP